MKICFLIVNQIARHVYFSCINMAVIGIDMNENNSNKTLGNVNDWVSVRI